MLNQESAGKTGTTDSNMSVWFMGYTPNLATAAMVAGANQLGHWITLNGQTIGGAFTDVAHGSTTAGPMWYGAMSQIQQWLPDATFTPPNGQDVNGVLTTVPDVAGVPYDQAAQQLSRPASRSPTVATATRATRGHRGLHQPRAAGARSPAARRSRSTAPNGTPQAHQASRWRPRRQPPRWQPRKQRRQPRGTLGLPGARGASRPRVDRAISSFLLIHPLDRRIVVRRALHSPKPAAELSSSGRA